MEGKIIMSWRKSSYSSNGGQCVEVGQGAGTVAVRDTKDRDGGELTFTASAWSKFITSVR